MYPLAALLRLRLYREENAKNEVARIEKIYRHEQDRLKAYKEEAEAYKLSIPERVEAEYATIIGKTCKLKDIDTVKARVADIEQVLVDMEFRVEEQRQVLVKCEEQLKKAREAVVFARKEAAKIEKHKEIWTEIQKKEAERLEDLEMEEFGGIKELG